MQFTIPTKLHFGSDALQCLLACEAERAFLLTDPFLAENHMADQIVRALPTTTNVTICTDVRPDPKVEMIQSVKEQFLHTGAEVLIAFGGGSAIDTAKGVIHLLLERGEKRPVFVAIPTTAGTGSEVTNFSVVTVGAQKEVWLDDALYPDHAVLYAPFTKTVPAKITADTGVDVLTHALEAYLSTEATPFTDLYATQAIASVFEHLPRVYKDGSLMRSRDAMLEASCMAGIAFTNAGLGINHSLAHILGGKHHKAHGRLNGILLRYVLRFHEERSETVRKRLSDLNHTLGLPETISFLAHVDALLDQLDFEQRLSDLGIEANAYYDVLGEMSEVAMADRCTPTNPVLVTPIMLANILRDAYEGTRISR